MASITCGNCTRTHTSVDAVRACHTGDLFTCTWMIQTPFQWITDPETGEVFDVEAGIRECGAEAVATDRGYTCTAGHEHINMQTRHAEGWDYAEDADEALGLMKAGVQPFTMDGHIATSPADFAPSTYTLAGVR